MRIVAEAGNPDVASVYIAEFAKGKFIECVEAIQPPIPREEKWVLLISTMFGCPVGCQMCDAGGHYRGKLSKEEIIDQIDYLVTKRYPARVVPANQFKIQFARMGEPALNPNVLDVLVEIKDRYKAPGLMPSLSTIGPVGCDEFLTRLIDVKNTYYSGGHFQFQFSIHSTDEKLRDEMIPVNKLTFDQMAEFGKRYYKEGDRKVTLNFALAQDVPVDAKLLHSHFDPDTFLVKITPLNPTYRARDNNLKSYINANEEGSRYQIVNDLKDVGFQVIVSIGALEENYIGSNCGQYVQRHLNKMKNLGDGYTYPVVTHKVTTSE